MVFDAANIADGQIGWRTDLMWVETKLGGGAHSSQQLGHIISIILASKLCVRSSIFLWGTNSACDLI